MHTILVTSIGGYAYWYTIRDQGMDTGKCDPKMTAGIAAARLISELDDVRVIGVGTGSTVAHFISAASRDGLLDGKVLVPSSMDTLVKLSRMGYHPVHPASGVSIDVYVDGADEVDPQGRLVKGRGAALLGEKILAFNSRYNIIVVDESKLVSRLGERKPIPVEVSQWALRYFVDWARKEGYNPVIREGGGKDGPVVSDWGGMIVDLFTGGLNDPVGFEAKVKMVPGVIEVGVFVDLVDTVIVGAGCDWRRLDYNRRRGRLPR